MGECFHHYNSLILFLSFASQLLFKMYLWSKMPIISDLLGKKKMNKLQSLPIFIKFRKVREHTHTL